MATERSFPGFEAPAAGFDEPFEMLAACHERVRRTLNLLERLCAYLAHHAVDGQARQAAKDVLRYFSMAAPAHHEDEERHIVPVLQRSGDPGLVQAAARMLEDHERIRATWSELEPLLELVVSGNEADTSGLSAATGRFVRLHDSHLALEDERAFPNARALHEHADPADLAEMGREMARRRLVQP